MEGLTSILRALKPKWGWPWGWVIHTLFLLLGKGIRDLIFCFPPEKWKFSSFCGTKRNKNLVVPSCPTSILLWPISHCINLALSTLQHHVNTYPIIHCPRQLTSSLFPEETRALFASGPYVCSFFWLNTFPTSLHTVILWSQRQCPLREDAAERGLNPLTKLSSTSLSLPEFLYFLPLLESKLHDCQTLFYLVFCSIGNTYHRH